ncbi:carboxymuconolactone decarboxylase family protein [Cognatishimia activa]|uniref:carboxymuconolactone decarboxylase family protein n=1 Tax=Cognatishimia activa TaxID=1715691 RepID=UPI0022317071|nr:carboxymuconolactone decarboxylase family protein [Cognatishimia activa]UZD91030.1 carboxymuconolactone decarboxylase family protein [Cognatishimia activa]
MQPRLNYWGAAPELMQNFISLNTAIEAAGLEASLRHLVKLRASQINGCAYCVDMHTREARKDGETEQRLYLVSAWHDSFLYSERERAAFKWTEALTHLGERAPNDALFEEVRTHFSEAEMVALTSIITMINTWNRLSVAFRAVHATEEFAAA